MAKLYFRYGTMGSGKSIDLLKVCNNYEEKGKKVVLFTAKIDNRYTVGKITSRIGISKDAEVFDKNTNLYKCIIDKKEDIACILIDESQFLTKKQVNELSNIVDNLGIPVICYGLRTDFKQELFEGSKHLLEISDKIEEIKTICKCGKKATVSMRVSDGKVVTTGEKILIGGDEMYEAVCRKCYKECIVKGYVVE